MITALRAIWPGSVLACIALCGLIFVALINILLYESDQILLGAAVFSGLLLANSVRRINDHTTAALLPSVAKRSFNATLLILVAVLSIFTLAAFLGGNTFPMMGSALLVSAVLIFINVYLPKNNLSATLLLGVGLYYLLASSNRLVALTASPAREIAFALIAIALLMLVRFRLAQHLPFATSPKARSLQSVVELKRAALPPFVDSMGETVFGAMRVPLIFVLGVVGAYFLGDSATTMSNMMMMYTIVWPALYLYRVTRQLGTVWVYTVPPSRERLAKKAVRRALLCTLPLIVLAIGCALFVNVGTENSKSTEFSKALSTVCITSGYLMMLFYCIGYRQIGRDYLAWIGVGIVVLPTLSVTYYLLGNHADLILGTVTIVCIAFTWNRGHLGLQDTDFLPAAPVAITKESELLYGAR